MQQHSGPEKKRFLPLVSMTSSMFLRDSGRASARRSEAAVSTKWLIRSRMVSHSAVKVGKEESGPRCCRKTCAKNKWGASSCSTMVQC